MKWIGTHFKSHKLVFNIGIYTLLNCLAFIGGSHVFAMPIDSVNHQVTADDLWNLEDLYKKPSSTWLKMNNGVRSLLFKSVDYKGKPTEVFAYYSDPDMLTGKSSKKKFPGIVLLHGGGGKAYQEWVEKWAAEGYAAIAIDFAGKDGEGNLLKNPGPAQEAEEMFESISKGPLKDVWTYHSVASGILAHSWLRSQPQVDSAMTFVTGISWGGYLTCIVASVDNRFKAAVPVYGCGYYGESDVFKNNLNELSNENRQKWLQYFDPSTYLPNTQVPFLFINGNKDKNYNLVPFIKSYSLVKVGNRRICYKPDMRHSHPDGWEPLEIRSYFDHLAYGYADSPTLGHINIKNTAISASYSSPVSIASARFYYTTDTLSTNENRKWESIKAVVDKGNKKISSIMPEGGFKYGFFYIKDHRSVTASSEILIRNEGE